MIAIDQLKKKAWLAFNLSWVTLAVLLLPVAGFLVGVYCQVRITRELIRKLFPS